VGVTLSMHPTQFGSQLQLSRRRGQMKKRKIDSRRQIQSTTNPITLIENRLDLLAG
jgi:hypothetical protein